MGIFSCLCCVCSWWACVPGGSMGLLKLSQPGRNWQAWKILASLENTGKPGKYWERCRRRCGTGGYSAGKITAVRQDSDGTGGCSHKRITAGLRWQHLTIYIENVIISVTMITKMLFVTRAPNLRCTAFLPIGV